MPPARTTLRPVVPPNYTPSLPNVEKLKESFLTVSDSSTLRDKEQIKNMKANLIGSGNTAWNGIMNAINDEWKKINKPDLDLTRHYEQIINTITPLFNTFHSEQQDIISKAGTALNNDGVDKLEIEARIKAEMENLTKKKQTEEQLIAAIVQVLAERERLNRQLANKAGFGNTDDDLELPEIVTQQTTRLPFKEALSRGRLYEAWKCRTTFQKNGNTIHFNPTIRSERDKLVKTVRASGSKSVVVELGVGARMDYSASAKLNPQNDLAVLRPIGLKFIRRIHYGFDSEAPQAMNAQEIKAYLEENKDEIKKQYAKDGTFPKNIQPFVNALQHHKAKVVIPGMTISLTHNFNPGGGNPFPEPQMSLLNPNEQEEFERLEGGLKAVFDYVVTELVIAEPKAALLAETLKRENPEYVEKTVASGPAPAA
jgi:hypothetical protein